MDIFVYNLLKLKTFLIARYNSFIALFTDVNEIATIHGNKKKYITVNYIFYILIEYFVKILKKIQQLVDVNEKIYHISLNSNYGNKTFIITGENMNFEYITNYIKSLSREQLELKKIIYRKISINDKICLKKYITKYSDVDKKFNNTLNNILLFEDIRVEDESVLNVCLIKNNKNNAYTKMYGCIKNVHISDLDEIIE